MAEASDIVPLEAIHTLRTDVRVPEYLFDGPVIELTSLKVYHSQGLGPAEARRYYLRSSDGRSPSWP